MSNELLEIMDFLFRIITAGGVIFYAAMTAISEGKSKIINYILMLLFFILMTGYGMYRW
jgi:hypothetical protein